MNAAEARTTLLEQHDRIRNLLEICTRLAKEQPPGEPVGSELDRALRQLRDDFAEHNESETAIIAELLKGPAPWGAMLVDRMLEEHAAEHDAFWAMLSGTPAELAERIHELAEELDAHIAAEERTFLSPLTLREDVIRIRTQELSRE